MISVIIPTYNRRHTLARALDSVFGQTLQAAEVIVIDDGSEDASMAWLAQHYPQVVLLSQSNQGVSAARNYGIKQAKSPWLAFLDSDDEWLPEKLAKQWQRIQSLTRPGSEHSAMLVSHCEEIWVRNGTRVNAMNKHKKHGGDIFSHCLPLCCVSPSATMLPMALLERVGLFDETLPACEDYDLWLRIFSRYPADFIEQPLLIKYGGHDDQLSRQHWGMDRFRVKALMKLLTAGGLTEEQFTLTRKMLEKKLKILHKGANKHGNAELLLEIEKWRVRLTSDFGATH